MMYVALTYDHRIIDGREAVTFLRRVRDHLKHPRECYRGLRDWLRVSAEGRRIQQPVDAHE
jgi:hypothetical protein